eukprot:TRINITY_DN12719_c0_g2_i1.p1 TRINITY_DN12719_c0_g2~~TRINITY_DN12719_c0_g2_i1.p1  ORF type:complete len:2025 (+),score=405.51 TRINITY_DN12719_c0_g2_i1:577-6075(+)
MALPVILDMSPFSFALELASLASKKELLDLEKWLNDNLVVHKDAFYEACLKFLRERTLHEASSSGTFAQRSSSVMNLSLETTAIFLKVLQAYVGQLDSRDLAEEMKKLYSAAVCVNPRLLSVGASDQTSSEVFSPDVEDEANSYFQKIYSGQLSIDAVVNMLMQFKESTEKREGEIFNCMLQSLFEEYHFFPKYPEKELKITAVLFGSIIKHQLVSAIVLGVALRYVLDALRKPLDSKMFSFGLTALEQFRDRLVEWPQYCNHILQISHLREAHGELIEFIDGALASISSSQTEQGGGNAAIRDQSENSIQTDITETTQLQTSQVGNVSVSTPALPGSGLLSNSRGSTVPVPRQNLNGFGHPLNIETLVTAAERRDTPIEAPSLEVQDKIAFMINNISANNLDAKSKEFLEVLKEPYYPWFAQYMVMKRASIEPNFHDLYLRFLEKINSKALHREIIKASYENCKVLLRSELIKSSSEERSLLKNLGSWLGKLTIGRNQALRAREIDPKNLIIEAYEKGLMIAVIPFTSKVLEPCQSSLAYKPPNPWTMGILGLLAEIYALPNLKMNLRFDIEVLFKNLGVDIKDVKPTHHLKGRSREIEGNPDFSNKDLTAAQPHVVSVTEHPAGSMVPMTHMEVQPELPVSHPSSHLQFAGLPIANNVGDDDKVNTIPLSDHIPAGMNIQHSARSQTPFSISQVSLSIPSGYVVINPKLGALGQHIPFQKIISCGMDRAVQEIITPVIERSVSIACMTTRELVLKDYCMESDESCIFQASRLMVASLAGSLAHVTCKEPLRVAMVNHLRSLFQGFNLTSDILEQAVQLVTNDNLDLGCAIIEQAATEKAIHDIEDIIATNVAIRRKQRDSVGGTFFEATLYSQGNLARLPESLRPKPGQLSPSQQRVYEDFARLPWQNQPSQNVPSAPSVSSSSSAASVAANFPRGVYGSASVHPSTGGYGAGHPNPELNNVVQGVEQPHEEVDYRAPSPISGSASQVSVQELGMRQVADVLSIPSVASSATEGNAHDGSSSIKESAMSVRPSTPSSIVERLGSTGLEPSLTTGEALDKYQVVCQKLESAIAKGSSEHEIQTIVAEIPEIILQSISRDEAALAIAQKVFKRLYENATNSLHVSTHIAVLVAIRDIYKRLVKELTSWVVYSDEDRKFNRDITVALVRSDLINLTEYNMHLAKLVDGGRNAAATEFAMFLVQTCVVQEPGISATELYNLIEALGKVAQRPGSPESLQQLMEDVRNASSNAASQTAASAGKEEKSRPRDKKPIIPGRIAGTREENKLPNREGGSSDPAGFREQVASLFDEWFRIHESSGVNEKAYPVYISKLQQSGMLKGDDVSDRFFRVLTELAVTHCLATEVAGSGALLNFTAIDILSNLVILLIKFCAVDPGVSKVNLLNKVLTAVVRVIQRDSEEKKSAFHPRPYFRLFLNWIMDFNSLDSALDANNFQVLNAFATAFHSLQPSRVPAFSFAWLDLISHRAFMPKLLQSKNHKGWLLFQRLLVDLFKFMEPYLRHAELSDPVKLLYKGTLRVLLVLLHDFPEFLCDYHFSFCDAIPTSCIQMRNLILSAFPRNMRLPDPFTPNLKVDLLPDISQSPRILPEVDAALKAKQLKAEVDEYLKTRQQMSMFLVDLKQRLLLPQHEALQAGTKYNIPLINSLVLYVGIQAIQQLQSKTTPQQLAMTTTPITHSAPMDIFQKLIMDLDTEGRYYFLNAVANQLRYPNNHTHYFSCVLLYLFAEANQEIIQEQITRVLLERLIVNRPHPWGLLITFIELIKNPRYNFWAHGFTRCAPEIQKLFESVARSCMGPSQSHMKAVEDDIASNMSTESNN